MPSEEEQPTTRFWICACGKIKLQITGDPFSSGNCHCHSCVAASRFLDEKFANKNTSAISSGGSGGVFLMPDQVTPITDLSSGDLFGCVKVGAKGKAGRKYCKCCGTQLGNTERAFFALNVNAIYNDSEGKSKYQPENPMNFNKKYAFDPELVPEPSHDTAAFGDVVKLMWVLLNPFGPTLDKDLQKAFAVDPSTAEEVAITWE